MNCDLQESVEDTAYLNLYPVAFQVRDAILSVMTLSGSTVSSRETRQESSISGAEVCLANASTN